MSVTEATNGRRIMPGHVYIAAGGRHLALRRSGGHYECHVYDGETVTGHRPSVDVLFSSFAEVARANAIGVILTGMGSDGAAGLLRMRQAGAHTVSQDEKSCLIYGMPRAAQQIGAVETELPLCRIAENLLAACVAGR